jgi:hypothetical protein
MLIGHPISGISLDASASLLAAPEMLPSRYLHQNRKFVRITMFWSGRGIRAGVAGLYSRHLSDLYIVDYRS